jgi:hypothetical protein
VEINISYQNSSHANTDIRLDKDHKWQQVDFTEVAQPMWSSQRQVLRAMAYMVATLPMVVVTLSGLFSKNRLLSQQRQQAVLGVLQPTLVRLQQDGCYNLLQRL